MNRRQEKERRRQEKRKRRQAARRARPRGVDDELGFDLRVRHVERARAPVFVDASGRRIADPYACLGLAPDPAPTPDEVLAAFRAALAATPPESDPERARELREARDFLLAPEQAPARLLGDLRVPDAAHFVPGYERRVHPDARAPKSAGKPAWSSRTRLVALMTLYALLAEDLEGVPPPRDPRSLFD